MPTPKSKLKFRRTWSLETRNGYRWATFEEVRNHLNTIARLGIPPLTRDLRPLKVDEKMLLLDGYMTSPSHHRFQVQQQYTDDFGSYKVVVKEMVLEDDKGTWETKSSACCSSDGFRYQVYHHVRLPHEARKTALLHAVRSLDTEAMYWLLVTATSSEELATFKLSLNQKYADRENPLHVKMVLCLLSSRIPFQLPLAVDSHGSTVIDYINQVAKLYKFKDFDLSAVNLLVGLFSAEIIHWKNNKGMSFLDIVEKEVEVDEGFLHLLTKLLSLSKLPLEKHLPIFKPRFEAVLCESIERGYAQLAEKLLGFKSEMATDASSLMRALRITVRKGSFHLLEKFFKLCGSEISVDFAGKDQDGKTLFHYAAESDNLDVLRLLDEFGRNAEGKSEHLLWQDRIEPKDSKGRTPLHIAAAKGNKKMVYKLLDLLENDKNKGDHSGKIRKYVEEIDCFCQTALQMACVGGHIEIVKVLLEEGNWKRDPVRKRDVYGKTALHNAAQANDPQVAVAICKQLLESIQDSGARSLLLWASAGGTGTADEGEDVHPLVKTFLEREKASVKTHLLREAAFQYNVEMAWELLNRGARIDDLRDPQWEKHSSFPVRDVLHQLELLKEQGRDQPSTEDNLGRHAFAEGLAALFLNRFIEPPITVGICGEWGMGKSSLMIQTEKLLVMTAAQLTFPNLLKPENFVGAEKISLSRKGRKIYEIIRKGAVNLLGKKEDLVKEENKDETEEKNLFFKIWGMIKQLWRNFALKPEGPLVKMLKEYQPQYHSVYKSLACMDSNQLLDSHQQHAFARVPRILTVRYNAWQYYDQHEAWAGLAVTITKEIEKSMTRAQWFSTGWIYSWNRNNVNMCFQVFLPCFIAAFLASWIAWGVWILLKKAKFQGLQYGSIPLTIMATVWIVLKSIISVVKPVSVQMVGYINSPDHTSRLGYQQQVIDDINFLKTELGKSPHWFFSLILGEWCWNWFGLISNNVEHTSIMKFKPASASEDQLRIITFVDDLDRCEEKVILQVLSAVNVVLANCDINVVLGIDKKMIERAIRRNFEDVEDVDIADKFMCKIIQIPLSLPDPTEREMNNFLNYQLGLRPEDIEDKEYTDYGSEDDVEDAENKESSDQHQENRGEDSCDGMLSSCKGIIGKTLNLLTCSLQQPPRDQPDDIEMCPLISSDPQQPKVKEDDPVMYPLTFSKGARLIREMLLAKHTEEEADILKKMSEFATGERKLPREWKRLLNYHRFASNVLTKRRKVFRLRTWKVELVAWIFVCWQWKHEMNTVIKGWSKFARMAGQNEVGHSRGAHQHGPSLGKIVENCVIELENSAEGNKRTAEKRDDYREVRGCLRQDNLLSLHVQGYVGSIADEDPSQKSWHSLKEALTKIQDVSMEGIELFQLFRLHCETDHLQWPLPPPVNVLPVLGGPTDPSQCGAGEG